MDRGAEFEQHRAALFGLAYRMLGTVAEAEDMVQEAYLRWAGAREEVKSPKAWLMAVVTRLCLDHLRSARVRRETYVGPWLPEPAQLEAPPADKESITYAFQVVMQSLSAPERAVFLLREVFVEDYAEIAAVLETTEANCRQLLRRAREQVDAKRVRFRAPAEQQRRLLDAFLQACTRGDVDGLMGMLAQDAVLYSDGGGKARAAIRPIRGANAIARFFVGVARKVPAGSSVRLARVNGEVVVVGELEGRPSFVMQIEMSGELMGAVYLVVNPEKLNGAGKGRWETAV
ncbi:MAG: RNA polymerase sigma-70 factor [Bryobacterales bacterium]|nr:RNA polymerase sigma-70 factor [Bryobacterales bacterium]